VSQDPQEAQNPFLAEGAHDRLPPFGSLAVSHIEPGIRALTERVLDGLGEVEASATPDWKGTVAAVEALTEPLFTAWGVVSHLMGVQNSLSCAPHDAVQKDVVQVSMRVAQSEPIYRAMHALKTGPAWAARRRPAAHRARGAARRGALRRGLAGPPKRASSKSSSSWPSYRLAS
jgi:oligopeptidase A